MERIEALKFTEGKLRLIDQRKLPGEYTFFECGTYEECEFAIRDMVIRGAPAIGAAAAYGVVLAAVQFQDRPVGEFCKKMEEAMDVLNRSRPTAVNLMWAIGRMRRILRSLEGLAPGQVVQVLKKEADTVLAEEIHRSEAIGVNGNALVPDGATILTHCNTGSLSVPGPGTALGVVRAAHHSGKDISVYADE